MKLSIRFSIWRLSLFAAVLAAALPSALAQQPDPSGNPGQDLTSLDLAQLLNVEVTTASRFPEDIAGAPAIMSVVTSDELRRFGGLTLGEVLQRVPGLNGASQNFSDRYMVSARGDVSVEGGHILFLINGRPTREVMEGGVISDLLESFPVDALERIEVIKGPGSVLYGSNAFSAVINLITRKAHGSELSASALGGAGGALDASGHFLYQRGAFSALASAQVEEAPGWPIVYQVPPSIPSISGAPLFAPTQDVSIVDKGAGGYLGVNYKGLSFMSLLTESADTAFAGIVGEGRLTRQFGNIGYDTPVLANWDMSFNLTYTRTTLGVPQYPTVKGSSDEFVAEWTNVVVLTPKDKLTAGLLFDRIAGLDALVIPYTVLARGSRPGGSFYAQIEHQFRPDLKLVAGAQINKEGDIPVAAVPRAGLIWTPSAAVSVKALYAQAFRAPSLEETLIDDPDLRGNPNLLPEKVGTFDLGIGFSGQRFQVGLDYFHSVQTATITTVVVFAAGSAYAQYVNLGRLTFNGGEAEGKYYFAKDFFAQASMLYQTNVGDGRSNITPVPNLSFKMGLSYENRRGLTLSLSNISDGPVAPYPGTVNPYQATHNVLNGNLRYDLTRYLPFGDRQRIALVAHALNLTNHSVWLPGWGVYNVDSIPVEQGRVIYAGLEFSLGKN